MATETLRKQQKVIKHHVMTAENRRENSHASATLTVQERDASAGRTQMIMSSLLTPPRFASRVLTRMCLP
jgi:hypothetical protein